MLSMSIFNHQGVTIDVTDSSLEINLLQPTFVFALLEILRLTNALKGIHHPLPVLLSLSFCP